MVFAKIFLALIVAVVATVTYAAHGSRETSAESLKKRTNGQTFLVDPMILPAYLLTIVVMCLLLVPTEQAVAIFGGIFVTLVLTFSAYYALLLCALPLLRRWFSARACATLWLLPTFLYFAVHLYNLARDVSPWFVITLPQQWLRGLIPVWAAGFAVVLLWQVVSHLRYRRHLLRGAEEVFHRDILSLWEAEQHLRGFKRDIPIVVSPNTRTPLTIGLYPRQMRLVLPHIEYTPEEFKLIFQHEARHIQRADTRVKAFLGFCAALCWFNPLMWIARRKVSDDLELSCDELVLTGADTAARAQYASLLLDTAGSNKGYTTCLSAGAASLRYRLKNVVKPRRRLSGTIAVGVVLFALLMSLNTVALADSPDTVRHLVFDQAPQDLILDGVTVNYWETDYEHYQPIYAWDEEPLTDYLASLTVKQVFYAGNYPEPSARQLYVDYAEQVDGEEKSLTRFELCDDLLWVNIPYDNSAALIFLVQEEVDWDYIESLLDFEAENPDPAPHPPEMTMYFDHEAADNGKPMTASRSVLSWTQGGQNMELTEWMVNPGVGGISGAPVTQVQLSFSYEPVDDYTIRVENWDHTESYCVSGADLTDGILPLAPYSAHYTVTGTFSTVRDTTYIMQFVFDVTLPEPD